MITFEMLAQSVEQFDNWTRPSIDYLRLEFKVEYLYRKQVWDKERSMEIGARQPVLFQSFEQFAQEVNDAPIVNIDKLDNRIENRSHSSTLIALKSLVASYHHPRDVDGIEKGFRDNAKMALPIVLKGKQGLYIFSGNTRLDVAELLGISKKAIIVDVSR